MRALLVVAMVALPAIAVAQPEHAAAPAEDAAEVHAGEHEPPADPTAHINWYKLHYGKDALGGPIGDGKLGSEPLLPGHKEEPMAPPFALMVLNFVVLALILYKFGKPVARRMAETRSDQIKNALDEAGRLRDQAKAKLEEYSAKLSAADAEITKMIEGMRTDAEADRKRVIAAAEAQAAELKKQAEERISAEIQLARAQLAREVAAAATAAAAKLIEQKATAADQTKIVDTFIADLGGRTGAAKEKPR